MADPVTEKGYDTSDDGSGSGTSPEVFERPKGLKGIYSHPTTQVAMLGLVCFMCPGLFNALSGMGGGGQIDETTGANANVALYSTFSVMAFFAGSVNNKLGARLTLQLGSLGYGLYIAGFLVLNYSPRGKSLRYRRRCCPRDLCGIVMDGPRFPYVGSTRQKGNKAKYIAIFWAIFNLGGVVGSAAGSVKNGTYIGFLVLTIIGATIPFFMVDPKNMIRTDGTKLTLPRNPSWKVEIFGLYVALKTDPMIILLFPMFLASNWFYTWQFNEYNGALFNIRTRALNSMLYWSAQIVAGWGLVFIMVFVVHIWAYEYQKDYTRASLALIDPVDRIDFSEKEYVGKVFLYIFFGILDAMWQTSVYWMMGAMSNDPNKLAYFTGFYKSIQSAGAAGSWRADAVLTPYMNMFASTWALSAAGLLFALPMIYLRVKDHTDLEDEAVARMDDDGHILPVDVAGQTAWCPREDGRDMIPYDLRLLLHNVIHARLLT
ncbi:MFS general substrate transporter [Mycena vulgaris]|nr:MFS general substrate transporter [Mycena vulgaris]